MPAQQLSGTTALVTGASQGFGRAIAVALSKHGAHVAVARDHGRLEELCALVDVQHVFNRTHEALLRELLSGAQVRPRMVPRHHASHHDRRGAAARTAHVRTTPPWPSSTPESRSA